MAIKLIVGEMKVSGNNPDPNPKLEFEGNFINGDDNPVIGTSFEVGELSAVQIEAKMVDEFIINIQNQFGVTITKQEILHYPIVKG